MELLSSPEAWISLATLSATEIVLGIDNIVFISILAGRLPKEEQPRARRRGRGFALASRIGLVFAGTIGDFVERHPTMKMLALSFLLLIGAVLVAESFGKHVEKGYIYFAMAFSFAVELLNIRLRRDGQAPAALHRRFEADAPAASPRPPA